MDVDEDEEEEERKSKRKKKSKRKVVRKRRKKSKKKKKKEKEEMSDLDGPMDVDEPGLTDPHPLDDEEEEKLGDGERQKPRRGRIKPKRARLLQAISHSSYAQLLMDPTKTMADLEWFVDGHQVCWSSFCIAQRIDPSYVRRTMCVPLCGHSCSHVCGVGSKELRRDSFDFVNTVICKYGFLSSLHYEAPKRALIMEWVSEYYELYADWNPCAEDTRIAVVEKMCKRNLYKTMFIKWVEGIGKTGDEIPCQAYFYEVMREEFPFIRQTDRQRLGQAAPMPHFGCGPGTDSRDAKCAAI